MAGVGPRDVAGQRGEYGRLVEWIRDSWLSLQAERDKWRFAWAQGQVPLTAGVRTYALPDDLERWDSDTLRIGGESVKELEWSTFRDLHRDAALQIHCVAIAPDGELHLVAPPEADGALTFEYWRLPQRLTGRNEKPRLPERYHEVIVYLAMREYGLYEGAAEVIAQAESSLRRILPMLLGSELPAVSLGGPLA